MPEKHPRMLKEEKTVEAMIRIYCRGRHKTRNTLCDDCSNLLDYARRRLDTCPFQEGKTSCGSCRVHCYKADMREKIRDRHEIRRPPHALSSSHACVLSCDRRDAKKAGTQEPNILNQHQIIPVDCLIRVFITQHLFYFRGLPAFYPFDFSRRIIDKSFGDTRPACIETIYRVPCLETSFDIDNS